MEKIKTIIEKEWAEVFKNRLVLFTVAFLPLILTALPLITIASMANMGGEAAQNELSEIQESGGDEFFGEQCIGLSEMDCVQVYMMNLFTLLFMMLPVMIPVTIAAYSIVGEKTTRTLEPLLATPITTAELLTGKAIAAVLPAILTCWVAFGVYTVGVKIIANDVVFGRLLSATWIIAIFIVGPLLSLLSVNSAILVSSRVTDPRVAEQLAGVVVLPIIMLMLGQSVGFILINQQVILIMGAVVALLDGILLYVTVQLFQREAILTRWK